MSSSPSPSSSAAAAFPVCKRKQLSSAAEAEVTFEQLQFKGKAFFFLIDTLAGGYSGVFVVFACVITLLLGVKLINSAKVNKH